MSRKPYEHSDEEGGDRPISRETFEQIRPALHKALDRLLDCVEFDEQGRSINMITYKSERGFQQLFLDYDRSVIVPTTQELKFSVQPTLKQYQAALEESMAQAAAKLT